MGLDLIGYKPWRGKRTEHNRRFLVIADSIVKQKLSSRWLIILLILGTFLVHIIPIILNSLRPHEVLGSSVMVEYMEGGLFYIFDIILVSLVCSDLIADDIRSNSIVLYLSRALPPERYLIGKWLGAMSVICLFTLIPPLTMSVAITATQTGPDYMASVAIIGQTFLAGLWTALFLVPIGLMISALTNKKTYAAVGTFMFFFVLSIMASILSQMSNDWTLLSPENVLNDTYHILFGLTLPGNVNLVLLGVMVLALTVPPIAPVYYTIKRKGVGK
jgi:ABC-type transport system involved in multi-copper enzyme maturation permease subunit